MGTPIKGFSSLQQSYPVIPPPNPPPRKRQGEGFSTTIEHLPDELLGMIFLYATNGGGDCKTLCSLRCLNSRCYQVLDRDVLGPRWRKLADEIGHPELRKLRELLTIKVFFHPKFRSLDFPSPTYFSRFAALTDKLRENGAPIPNHLTVLGFEARFYEQMQQKIDLSREAVWPYIWRCIEPQGAALLLSNRELHNQCLSLLSVEQRFNQPLSFYIISEDINLPSFVIPGNGLVICLWFNNPANAEAIDRIFSLNLSKIGLTALPPEIGYLTQLSRLWLGCNQLTGLPSGIGDLTNLTKLDLSRNLLTCLPKTIGNLTNLTELNLSRNRLTSLPRTISDLTQLRGLSLDKNQLTSLPSTLGNIIQLKWLFLHDNPLIFILDQNLKEIVGITSLSLHQFNQKEQACSSYPCRSPLALLCQEIHLGKDRRALQKAFDQLPHEMKQLLCHIWAATPSSSSSSSEAEQNLFADRTSFVKAVMKAIKERLNGLSEQQRNRVDWHLWDLAGRPERGESKEWREKLAKDNIIRLVDAIELTIEEQQIEQQISPSCSLS